MDNTTDKQETASHWLGVSASGSDLNGLLPPLRRLDRLLETAIAAAQNAYGQESSGDLFRGLYISQDEVKRMLAREPGKPLLWADAEDAEKPAQHTEASGSRIAWLKQAFDLLPFELDVLIVALAPELDLRYERFYAFLQDDVSKRRPSIDLALNLLCPDAETKLLRRTHFAADAPLVRHHLVHLITTPHHEHQPLLAHTLKLDEQIVNLLLGHDRLDSRLAPFCNMLEPIGVPGTLPLNGEAREVLPRLVAQAHNRKESLRLYFHGSRGVGKRRTAEALAAVAGMPLLVADMAFAPVANGDFPQVLRVLFREAWFRGAMLYIDNFDELGPRDSKSAYERLLYQLVNASGVTILAGGNPWVPDGRYPTGVVSVPFPLPDVSQRKAYWQANLDAAGISLRPEDVDALSGRFRLTPGQIDEAFIGTLNRACWRAAGKPDEGVSDLLVHDFFAAAREQCGHELSTLTRRIKPVSTWADLILPEDALVQLREICKRLELQQRVLADWGFGSKLSQGKGVNALFAGPSGTGKTMAAEIIAHELQLDLYKVDLSGIVSKYIGETEKNLDRIFRAAEDANAILFFDEADALFGKRSEVRDSHDRYANIEISYLLQKMELYEGLAILATNLRQNLDDAFLRRLAFTVQFPAPDEVNRLRIWTGIWPAETPLSENADLPFMARQFKVTGGNIKNIALAAAFLAAEHGGAVTMAHLLHATRREYQKLGKALSEAELNGRSGSSS